MSARDVENGVKRDSKRDAENGVNHNFARAVKAVGNDNGSSDTATAALIYARYAGFDDKKASRFAVAAAVLNTESMEAVHESLDADLVLSYMEKIHERA